MKKILAVVTLAFSAGSMAQTLCPDGSYVDQGPCEMCADGSYIGSGGRCQLAPDGSYVRQRGDYSQPRQAPDGTWVSGDAEQAKLCPDGSYVAGSRCILTPDGGYIGTD